MTQSNLNKLLNEIIGDTEFKNPKQEQKTRKKLETNLCKYIELTSKTGELSRKEKKEVNHSYGELADLAFLFNSHKIEVDVHWGASVAGAERNIIEGWIKRYEEIEKEETKKQEDFFPKAETPKVDVKPSNTDGDKEKTVETDIIKEDIE